MKGRAEPSRIRADATYTSDDVRAGEIRLTYFSGTVTATRRAKGCIRCWCSGVYMTAARRELFRR